MRTDYINCDFCRGRIMPGQYRFELRAGTVDDTWSNGRQKDACAPCVMDQEKGILATSDFNIVQGLRVPDPPPNPKSIPAANAADRW